MASGDRITVLRSRYRRNEGMTRKEHSLFARAVRAAVFASFVLLVACGSPAPMGRVNSFDVDPRTNVVVGATITIPSRFVAHDRPKFYMKTNHGETSAWKIQRVRTSRDLATLDLASANYGRAPGINAAVAVYFRDRDNDLEVLPLAVTVAPVLPLSIANPNFTAWTPGMPSPDDWPVRASSRTTSFDVVRIEGRKSGIRLSVATRPVQHPGTLATPIPGAVEAATISQTVILRKNQLYVEMRPFQSCVVDGGHLTVATGVEISSGSRPLAFFCVGQPFETRATLAGRVVFVKSVPGTIGVWNYARFNIRSFLSSNRKITIGFTTQVDTVRSPYDWATLDVASVLNEK